MLHVTGAGSGRTQGAYGNAPYGYSNSQRPQAGSKDACSDIAKCLCLSAACLGTYSCGTAAIPLSIARGIVMATVESYKACRSGNGLEATFCFFCLSFLMTVESVNQSCVEFGNLCCLGNCIFGCKVNEPSCCGTKEVGELVERRDTETPRLCRMC